MSLFNVIQERDLTSLYHFTTIENYISILERGFIYSRSKIDQLKIENDGYFTGDYTESIDQQRLDGLRDYINLSLSRPNWYLLRRYKERQDLADYQWCILELDISPLLLDSTLYSVCNAASYAAKQYGVKSSVEGLKALFQNNIQGSQANYSRHNLPKHYTTDIQAEVLVKDQIATSLIKHSYLPSSVDVIRNQNAFKMLGLGTPRFTANPDIFQSPMLK